MSDRVFNFAAGPSMMPLEVLERAGSEITNYHNSGMSVMEMSHRSSLFQEIFDHAQSMVKSLLHVPDNYAVLFLQGGGSTQFSMVPLNLISRTGKADYAVTGNFSRIACNEAKKYGTIHIAASTEDDGFSTIPTQEQLDLDPNAGYFHYCANNTIYGTEWMYTPDTGNVPLVADMSSDLTSRVIDISRYGLIYAGAQKNMGPAGVTVVIIRKDLAGHALEKTPLMMDYGRMIEKNSMYNTPPCWCIYMLGLQMDWLAEQGGVEAMEQKKHEKAQLLYDAIDNSTHFHAHAKPGSRSDMNVTFRSESDEIDARFIAEAAQRGLVNVKGHRLVKGMRASIYNAMPLEGVEKLRDFIEEFDRRI